MLTKTKIALAAALILGTASAALAGDSGSEPDGGYVVPGSMDGVNPAYHPGIFANPATAKAYGFARSSDGTWHVQANSHQGTE
jgi:hypothetical protein